MQDRIYTHTFHHSTHHVTHIIPHANSVNIQIISSPRNENWNLLPQNKFLNLFLYIST